MIYHYNERALTRGGLRAGEMPTRDVYIFTGPVLVFRYSRYRMESPIRLAQFGHELFNDTVALCSATGV